MLRIGFIGAGNMAEALMKGIVKAKVTSAQQIILSDINQNRLQNLEKRYGARIAKDNSDLIDQCDTVVLAVKPQIMKNILQEISPAVKRDKLFISIAAGIQLAFLKTYLGEETRVIRVMPNTPALVLQGMTAICSDGVVEDDIKRAEQIFSAVGQIVVIKESLIDAVTGLSGSGPAYIAIAIEALTDGGVLMGLPRQIAQGLAIQTVLGTAQLLKSSQDQPIHIKNMVSSPGGTTIHGIHALEKGGLRASLIEAVRAATVRSQELGKGSIN